MLHCRLTFNVQHIPLEDNNVPVQGRLEILLCLLTFNITWCICRNTRQRCYKVSCPCLHVPHAILFVCRSDIHSLNVTLPANIYVNFTSPDDNTCAILCLGRCVSQHSLSVRLPYLRCGILS